MAIPLKAIQITKAFNDVRVLDGLSLSLTKGETLSLMGASGSGKTTLMKVLAGIEAPDLGTIRIQGEVIDTIPIQKRKVVYLYQEPLLFPHLNLFDNVAFGLRLQNLPQKTIQSRTMEMIKRVGLSGMESRRTQHLSGGQKQRVAFARALITQPNVLLLDEPFSNLDSTTRSNMQKFYKEISKEFDMTTLFVTHSLKEGIIMGDRYGYLDKGVLNRYKSVKELINSNHDGVQSDISFWSSYINDIKK